MPRKLDPTLLHAITPPAFDKGKLHRADLVDRIHANLEKSLIVIAAPAGYGKTTLLADFTAHTDMRVCWVRLDEQKADVGGLATLVLASIRKQFHRVRSRPDPRFDRPSSPKSTARVLSAWIEEGVLESFVLIVDDVHYLERQRSALEFLDELVGIRPSSMTIVVSGRDVAELSLARLLAEGQLAGLGPHDLSLTRNEVAALSELTGGHRLAEAEVTRVYETSKGWVTGVVLSRVFARGAFGGIPTDTSPLIYEYLSSVVLNTLPDDLRRFTLDVSVLPVMIPSICDELLRRNDSSRMLRQLARKGVFLDVSDGEPPSYAFHSLFRTFLSDTLSAVDHPRQSRLLARAASILERRDSPELAVRLLVDAGLPGEASLVAEKHARSAWVQGRIQLLEEWWRLFQDDCRKIPELTLSLATSYMDRGDVDLAEDMANKLQSSAGMPLSNEYSLRLANLRAGIAFHRGLFAEAVRLSEEVVAEDTAAARPMTLAIALETKARSLAAQRTHLREALGDAQTAVDIVSSLKDPHATVRALTNLVVVLESLGEFRSAATIVEQVSSVVEGTGSPVERAYATGNLAQVRHRQGDLESALSMFSDALRHARQAAHPYLEALMLYWQADVFNDVAMAMQAAQLYGEGLAIAARLGNKALIEYGCLRTSVLYRRRGNLTVSNEWMQRALQHPGEDPYSSSAAIQIASLEVAAAPRNAIATLRRVIRGEKNAPSPEEEIVAMIFLAKAYGLLADQRRCRETIEQVLTLAGTRGLEQYVAGELISDEELLEKFRTLAAGSPTLEIVAGRIEMMRSFLRSHAAEAMPKGSANVLRINALGRSQIIFLGKTLRGLKKQAKEVIFYLIDAKAASKEAIAEIFWPNYPPGRRSANVHTVVHSIRAALGKSALQLEDGLYRFNPAMEVSYDAEQFEKTAEVAQRLLQGDPRKYFALTEAVSLYSGPFMDGSESQWCVERRRQLELLYLGVISSLGMEALTRNQPERAVEHLRRGLAIDPLRDDLNKRYLEALGRLGQVGELSAHYRVYTRLIRDELGIDPPEEIRSLYSRLIG